ncbi:Uncharacterised protein [Burkholderia pseudomallei]|nr:Uncharacterised protein [Burkholderia pseudomallei]
MQLLSIGEAALHRLLAPRVNALAPFGQAPRVHPLLGALPHVARYHLHRDRTVRALRSYRAAPADLRIGFVFPIAEPIGRAVRQGLPLRAHVFVAIRVVLELPFVEHARLVVRRAIAHHPGNPSLLQPLAHRRREVARIQPHRLDLELKALALAIQPIQIRLAVMHRGRRHMRIGDDRVLGIHRAVVQIEEPLRLVVPHHVAAVRIGPADLGVLARRRLIVVAIQRLLAMRGPVRIHCRVQCLRVGRRRLLQLHHIELALVRVRLQVRAVRVQHPTVDQPALDRLPHDLVEDLLIHRRVREASAAILRER